jgi:hypothetical protein
MRSAFYWLVLVTTVVAPSCDSIATRTFEFDATFTVHATDVAATDLMFDTSRRWMGASRNFLRFDLPTSHALFSPDSVPEAVQRAIHSRTRAAFDAALSAICAAEPSSPLLALDDARMVRDALCVPVVPGSSTFVARPYCLTAALRGAPHADPSPVDAPAPPRDLDGDFCGGPGTPVTIDTSGLVRNVTATAVDPEPDAGRRYVVEWVVSNSGTTAVWFDRPALLQSGAPELSLLSTCPESSAAPLLPGLSCRVRGLLVSTEAAAGERIVTLVMRAHEFPSPGRRLITNQVLHASATLSFDGGLSTVTESCRPSSPPPELTCEDGTMPRDSRRLVLGITPAPGAAEMGDWFLTDARASNAEVVYRGACARVGRCAGSEPLGIRRFGRTGAPVGGPVSIARSDLGLERRHELWVLDCGAGLPRPAEVRATVLEGVRLEMRQPFWSLSETPCR